MIKAYWKDYEEMQPALPSHYRAGNRLFNRRSRLISQYGTKLAEISTVYMVYEEDSWILRLFKGKFVRFYTYEYYIPVDVARTLGLSSYNSSGELQNLGCLKFQVEKFFKKQVIIVPEKLLSML